MSILTRLRNRARGRGQHGFTVLELTIGMAMMMILSTASLLFLNATQQRIRYTSKETESLDGARTTLARLSSEVRAAAAVYPAVTACPSSTCLTMTFVPPTGGTVNVRYRYDSGAKMLYRSTGSINLSLPDPFVISGSESPVVSNMVNGTGTAVFCRQAPCTVPSETAIEIVLVVNAEPSKPAQNVTLQSYLSPRNL